MIKYILTLIYICFTTGGMYLMKMGGDSLSLSFRNGITFKIGFITCLGFICYLCSFLLWQKLLVTFDLTYIVPITTGICQIIILLIGTLAFKEQINLTGIIGIILVIIGVILLMLGKK